METYALPNLSASSSLRYNILSSASEYKNIEVERHKKAPTGPTAMKIVITYLTLTFCSISAFGQIPDGKLVLSSTITAFNIGTGNSRTVSGTNPALRTASSGWSVITETTIGRFKNQSLVGYGLNFYYSFGAQSNNSVSNPADDKNYTVNIAPVVSYQKFYRLSDKLFYSPVGKVLFGYQYSKYYTPNSTSYQVGKGINGRIEIHPFSMTFIKSPKTNFLFTIGNVVLDYTRIRSQSVPNVSNTVTTSSLFSLNAQLGGIGFGIQKIL